MSDYSAHQWVLFFFFYCFCGWLWESCYVSARQHRWVNRGFLHGPLLPIYGSGAIIILFATLPVRSHLALVYLLGMLSATLLEYATGAAMEGLFKVRYWDYSNQKYNLHGYICLSSSLAWGVFSILLVHVVHPPVEQLVLRLPQMVAEPLAFLLVAGFSVDAVQSFRAAMDLREILVRLTEENEEIRRIAKRVEVYSVFAEEELRSFREKTEVEKLLLANRIAAGRSQHTLRRQQRQEAFEAALQKRSEAKLSALKSITGALETYRDRLDTMRDLTGEALEKRKAEIGEALEKLRTYDARIRTRSARSYRQSMRILRGNPTAATRKYAEVLENLRKAGGLHREKD